MSQLFYTAPSQKCEAIKGRKKGGKREENWDVGTYPVAQTSLRDLSFFVVGAIKQQKLQKFGQLFKGKHLAVLNLMFLQESC